MSITITGGISFSGGVGIVAPPPSTPTAGWFGGGYSGLSTVQRITFATDSATATVRGPMNTNRMAHVATGTFNDGWFGGGLNTQPPATTLSSVSRITYATDTATGVAKGNLSVARFNLSATGDNTTYGWYMGGTTISGGPYLSTIDRITYATDTATASVRGPLSSVAYSSSGATTDGTTYAWTQMGRTTGGSPLSSVDRITYANDTAISSPRGPLSISKENGAATGTSTYGWFAGGSYPSSSMVSRITYATDTDTGTTRGPLSANQYRMAAATDGTTYGWFGGGVPYNAGFLSTVNRITYATDTATASVRGALAAASYRLAASSGIQ
jgi:hypothetical protein